MTDFELIQQFRAGNDQAFTDLVNRHVQWVRAAATRRVRDAHLAEDVTQGVFILLARKAGSIKAGMVVSAWLFQAVRYCSSSALRGEGRRKHHEQEAAAMRSETRSREGDWSELVPLLDESVARLGRRDREAVLLRFYEQKQFSQVGAALGISEEGARKRVSRAIARLRGILSGKGVLWSIDALPAALLAGLATGSSVGVGDVIGTAALTAARAKGTATGAALLARGAERLLLWGQIKIAAAICASTLIISGAGVLTVVAQTRPAGLANAPATMLATDVVKLVQDAKNSQAWLARVQSFHSKLEGDGIANPEGVPTGPPPKSTVPPNSLRAIGAAIEAFSDKQAATQPAAKSNRTRHVWEFAFDQTRLYDHVQRDPQGTNNMTEELRIWDGKTGMQYLRLSDGSEEYGLWDQPKQLAEFFLSQDIFGRNGQHYWWSQQVRAVSDFIQAPDDYGLAGREVFHGTDCFVLKQQNAAWNQLWIGVNDHRLYGFAERLLPDSVYAQMQTIRRQVASEMGKTIRSDAELTRWVKSLSPEKLKQMQAAESSRLAPLSVPWVTFWYEDYREVAPGCWYPSIHGQEIWDHTHAGKPFIAQRITRKVALAEANKPLREELFAQRLKDGVIVWDSRENPTLAYLQKADRSVAEWAAIRADAMRAKTLNEKKQFVQQLYGTTAAEFPNGAKWLGSGPLKMANLRGKVVIVFFWADWRGLGEYVGGKWKVQWPDALKAGGPRSEIALIGVHAPTSDVAQVEQAMTQYAIKFPVCIDVPMTGKPAPWGVMSEQFRVTQLPETYLIDQQGKIVGTYGWPEVIKKAQALVGDAGL